MIANELPGFLSPPDENGCTVWMRSRCRDGYGTIRVDGRTLSTHRVAWELANGPIPPKQHVLHHCDNPPCCNPEHLFLGTHTDNMADRARKGRTNRDSRNQGKANGNAKLTDDLVIEIRHRVAVGERRSVVAASIGVHRATVDFVVNRKIWSHVPDLPNERQTA